MGEPSGLNSSPSAGNKTVSCKLEENEATEEIEQQSNEVVNAYEHTYEPDVDEKRFTALRSLLKQSETYTDFLKARMSSQNSTRKFERSRKQMLMKHFKSEYERKGIRCDKYLKDSEVFDNENLDPYSVLDGKMLNVAGEVVSLKQPFSLQNSTLRSYQVEGLCWLKTLFEFGINGILADEMGLGKTIQCISVIAHLLEMGVDGYYLVVAPLSTLYNWMSEFQRFAPRIPVVMYHGSKEVRKALRRKFVSAKFLDLNVSPVIVTSYEIAMKDRSFFTKFKWRYLVVDEGHRLKNFNCRLVRELKYFKASCRLILTGTPLQNNLLELWSLMNFLLPEVFADLENFESWFDADGVMSSENCSKIIKMEREQQVLSTMHRILRPFVLRRKKSEVEVSLPPKKEVLVYAPLTEVQKEYYKATIEGCITKILGLEEDDEEEELEPPRKFRRNDKEDSVKYGLRSTLPIKWKIKTREPTGRLSLTPTNITMQLRKIVNHPYLVNFPIDPATEELKIDEDIVKSCGKLLVLDAMLCKLKEMGHKILLFSQMTRLMDILEEYLIIRNYSYVRFDGTTKIEERQAAIEKFSQKQTFIFLLSTRAGGLGINLTAADTVIIYDSDWNPQCDFQAIDRCHRIGQTCPVVVYRLVTAGTIDECVLNRARAKTKLEVMVIEKGNFKNRNENDGGISIQELQELLKSTDDHCRIHPNGFVFSDDDLCSLLDRSHMLSRMEDSLTEEVSSNKGKLGEMDSPKQNPVALKLVNKRKGLSRLYKVL